MVVGFVRGVWQFWQVHLGGCMICVGVFGFGLVWPLCPLGGPGKRFLVVGLYLFMCVLYMRMDGGVWGFWYFWRARVSLVISVFSFWFSCVSCSSFWQVWQVWVVIFTQDMLGSVYGVLVVLFSLGSMMM